MFPVGAAGCGLLILRLCAAGMLLHDALSKPIVVLSSWETAGLILLAGLLCLGAFTPLSCIASGLAQIAMVLGSVDRDPFQFGFSLSVTAALLLIGPGAFSVDSRLFGRRLIIRSSSK